MGYFDGLSGASYSDRGVFLSPGGSYELELEDMLVKRTRKGKTALIVEFKVIDATGEGALDHAEGSKATWFQGMDDEDIFISAALKFAVHLFGINPKDKEALADFQQELPAVLDEATAVREDGADNPLKGYRIHCDTHTKVTQKGTDFTVHVWSPSQSGSV